MLLCGQLVCIVGCVFFQVMHVRRAVLAHSDSRQLEYIFKMLFGKNVFTNEQWGQ